MKSTDYAWLAGIIDGEGCITVNKQLNLWVQVGMTHRPTMERLLDFGGTLRNHTSQSAKWRQRFMWVVTGQDAVDLLKKTMPYMVTKQEEAVLALTLDGTFRKGGKAPMPEAVRSLRLRVRETLQVLKRVPWEPLEGRITTKDAKKEKAA
jgi:hypothetical protein